MLPGERLSTETIDFIADSLAHGGQVRGASDRTLRTVRVVIEMTDWGSDSEYGLLHDVLLCPPVNFRWLPTSVISKGTLASGRAFDAELASTAQPRDGHGLRGGRRQGPPARAGPAPALPGVRPRFERRDPEGTGRHPDGAAVAPRRVRAGDPLLRGRRDPDPRDDHRGRARGRRRDHRRARQAADRQRRGAHPGPGGRAARRLVRGARLGGPDRGDPRLTSSTSTCSSRCSLRSSPRSASRRRRRAGPLASRRRLRDPRGLRRGRLRARRQRDLARRRIE